LIIHDENIICGGGSEKADLIPLSRSVLHREKGSETKLIRSVLIVCYIWPMSVEIKDHPSRAVNEMVTTAPININT